MARPKKKGLLYFPYDVDIFEDDKVIDLSIAYGPLGEAVFNRLLCYTYKEGYYYEFQNIDKLATKLIRSIGNRWARDKKTVIEIILYLAEINLFSAELMQRNVITSRSIQERYLKATERSQSKIEKYSLLEFSDFDDGLITVPENQINVAKTTVNVAETPDNEGNNAIKKSKEKKSKVNESKENSGEPDGSAPTPSAKKPVRHKYGEYKHVMLTDEQHSKLTADFGDIKTADYIRQCDEYCEQHGKHYSNYYLTIRNWIKRDEEKGGRSSSSKQRHDNSGASYDLSEWERYAFEHDPNLKGG